MRPMLAESITMDQLPRYARDDNWCAQLKADGHRYLVEVNDGVVTVVNRAGMPKTSLVNHATLGEFEAFDKGRWVFDGELVDNQLLIFDLPVATTLIGEHSPFEERYQALELLEREWKPNPSRIQLLPCAWSEEEKLLLAKTAQNERREGIMLRHRQGIYRPGTRSHELLKAKFVKDIDVIVTALRHENKDNAVLSLLDPENNRVVNIGRASTIGKKPEPQVGDVWEVRFLYVVDPDDPKLYQPRLMRKRDDKGLHECLIDQIADAFTDKDLNLTKNRSQM
jgi:ATP-dependent DNA ligase